MSLLLLLNGNFKLTVAPGTGVLTVAGQAPAVRITTMVRPRVGAVVVAGFAPTVSATTNTVVRPGVGSLIAEGFAPSVTGDAVVVSPPGGIVFMRLLRKFEPHEITYEGYAPTVLVRRTFTSVPPILIGASALELDTQAEQYNAPVPGQPEDVRGSAPTLTPPAVTYEGFAPTVIVTESDPAPVPAAVDAPITPDVAAVIDALLAEPEVVPAPVVAFVPRPATALCGTGAVLLTGFAPSLEVTTFTKPTPWTPEQEQVDDDTELYALAYQLLTR